MFRLDRGSNHVFLGPNAGKHEGRLGLQSLLAEWKRLGTVIPEARIRDGLRGLRLDRQAFRKCLHFEERTCQPTRIHASEHFEVLVFGWRAGQAGAIHDQGGSTSGVLVVEGVATEIAYMTTGFGRLAPSRSQRVHAGAVLIARGRDVHQLSNLEPPGTDLVTLHVSSPPLEQGKTYRLSETSFADHDVLLDEAPAIRIASL